MSDPTKPIAAEDIPAEARMVALEYLFSNLQVNLWRMAAAAGVPIDKRLEHQQETLRRLADQQFPGADPVMADHMADELRRAVKRLIDMQNEMFGSAPENKEKSRQ